MEKFESQENSEENCFTFLGNTRCSFEGFTVTKHTFFIRLESSKEYAEFNYDGEPTLINMDNMDTQNKHNPLNSCDDVDVIKVKRTFHDAWYFKCHGIKTPSHLFLINKDFVQFSNVDDYPIIKKMNSQLPHFSELEEWELGTLKLTRWTKMKMTAFIISKISNNAIVSLMSCGTDFCDGDSGTHVYLLRGKNILICNHGDSPSVLLIRNEQNIPSDMRIQKVVNKSCQMKNNLQSFTQSIVDFLYTIFDEQIYKISYQNENPLCFFIDVKEGEYFATVEFIDGQDLLITTASNTSLIFSINQIDHDKVNDIFKLIWEEVSK